MYIITHRNNNLQQWTHRWQIILLSNKVTLVIDKTLTKDNGVFSTIEREMPSRKYHVRLAYILRRHGPDAE